MFECFRKNLDAVMEPSEKHYERRRRGGWGLLAIVAVFAFALGGHFMGFIPFGDGWFSFGYESEQLVISLESIGGGDETQKRDGRASEDSSEEMEQKLERERQERHRADKLILENQHAQRQEIEALGQEQDKRRVELLLKGQHELKQLQGDIFGAIEEGLDWLEENKRARSVERPLQPYEPAYKPDSEPVIQHSQRELQVEPSDGGVQKNGFITELRRVEPSVEINITSEEVLLDSILIKDATNEKMVYPESPHWYGFTTDAPVIWIRVWGARQRSNRLKLRVRDGEVVAVDVVQEVDVLTLKKRKQKRLPY